MIDHDNLLQQHEVGADSLIKQRSRVIQNFCTGTRYLALNRKLIGHLCFLAEGKKEIDLKGKKRLVQNLCAFALTPAFQSDVASAAVQLVEAQLFVDEQLDALFDAIDITGFRVWKPVLQYIVNQQLLNDAVIWKLAGRFSPLIEVPERLILPAETFLHPGQLSVLLRQANANIDRLLQGVSEIENANEFHKDLNLLALSLHKRDHAQTDSMLMHWHEIAPESAWVYNSMIATGREVFTEILQHGVRKEVIQPLSLAFHGSFAHISFCLELLENPRFNLSAAELWQSITSYRLPRTPRLHTVDNELKKDGKGELASVDEARRQLKQFKNGTALWQGKPFSTQAIKSWCLTSFGATSELALMSLWANSTVDFAILPNEPLAQRITALKGVAA